MVSFILTCATGTHRRMHTITHVCLNTGRLQAEPIFTYRFQQEEGEAERAQANFAFRTSSNQCAQLMRLGQEGESCLIMSSSGSKCTKSQNMQKFDDVDDESQVSTKERKNLKPTLSSSSEISEQAHCLKADNRKGNNQHHNLNSDHHQEQIAKPYLSRSSLV